MGKWTDELHAKEKHDAEARAIERAAEIQSDQLIYQKGPEFWRETIAWLKQETEALKLKYPSHANRHVNVREFSQQINVEAGTFPQTRFVAPLVPTGKSLLIDFWEHQNRHDSGRLARTAVDISVDEGQHVHFDYEGTSYIRPEEFGGYLLSKVLKLNA